MKVVWSLSKYWSGMKHSVSVLLTTITSKKWKKILLENRCVGIREVAQALNIFYGSTQHIVIHVLGMKRVAGRQTRTERLE